MVNFYVARIKLKKAVISDIPERWRDEVLEILLEAGYALEDIS